MMRTTRRLLGGLGLGWALWRLFGPERQPSHDGPQERPLHVPGRTVLVGEQEFFVREAGSASAFPLVLIHGWGFDGEMNYYKVIPGLAEQSRVVVPDQRNHGKSDRIRGRVEIEDLAAEIVGMLDELGYAQVDVFGYSLGGMAAQVIAHRHPERVRRLILAGTAAFPVDRFRFAALVGFWLARAVARLSKTEAVILTYRFLLRSGIVEGRHARWLWAAMLNRDPTLFYESGKAAWRFDARPWVGEIEAPVMVIIPTSDQIVPTRAQRELAVLIDADQVVEVAGAGHESILSRPEEYVAAIRSFLSGDG
jgi:3-oxoadipate enol-lactonase